MSIQQDYALERQQLWITQLVEARRMSRGILEIRQITVDEYQITTPDEDFYMDVFVTNKLIKSDPEFGKPPFLSLPQGWDLLDLVDTLLQAIKNQGPGLR